MEKEGTEKFSDLCKKKYSAKEVGISYRILSSWSSLGLINHLRDKENDWHRFSAFDLIEIRVYDELRQVGFSVEKLLKIKKFLRAQSVLAIFFSDSNLSKEYVEDLGKSTILVESILRTAAGENIFLVIDKDAANPMFAEETIVYELLAQANSIYNEYGGNYLVLSVRTILENVSVPYEKSNHKLGKVLTAILDSEEQSEIKLFVQDCELKKAKHTLYDVPLGTNITALIKQPNRKTSFSSNNNGSVKMKIEAEL
ncbi:MAG: hypothetical protein WCT32_01250 [Patescibacteria group bacterium]|jgi:DNA-binding transcriptional MerR regulator